MKKRIQQVASTCFPFEVMTFKSNFLRCWGWTVHSLMSVYVKFNILQNGIKNKNESSHFKPNTCQSYPTVINAVKISMQNAVFYNKICNVILINHIFWQVWNISKLTKCIMLCIYNYFAIKLLFCQTLICELKHLKFSVVPYYLPGLNMALVCNCTAKP